MCKSGEFMNLTTPTDRRNGLGGAMKQKYSKEPREGHLVHLEVINEVRERHNLAFVHQIKLGDEQVEVCDAGESGRCCKERGDTYA
jgi:disulfide oxidoreductase YuzD